MKYNQVHNRAKAHPIALQITLQEKPVSECKYSFGPVLDPRYSKGPSARSTYLFEQAVLN
jgi:hypothetical protein